MIREPYNIFPYNQAIDLTKENQFSFNFSGDVLTSYRYCVRKNNSPETIFKDTELFELKNPIYNGERVSIPVSPLLEQRSLMGKDPSATGYLWKMRLLEDPKDQSMILSQGQVSNAEVCQITSEEYSTSNSVEKDRYCLSLKGDITSDFEKTDSRIFIERMDELINSQKLDSFTPGNAPSLEKKPVEFKKVEYPTITLWDGATQNSNQYRYSIADYESHYNEYYNITKPGTYYIGSLRIDKDNSQKDVFCRIKRTINQRGISTSYVRRDDPLVLSSRVEELKKFPSEILLYNDDPDWGNKKLFRTNEHFPVSLAKNIIPYVSKQTNYTYHKAGSFFVQTEYGFISQNGKKSAVICYEITAKSTVSMSNNKNGIGEGVIKSEYVQNAKRSDLGLSETLGLQSEENSDVVAFSNIVTADELKSLLGSSIPSENDGELRTLTRIEKYEIEDEASYRLLGEINESQLIGNEQNIVIWNDKNETTLHQIDGSVTVVKSGKEHSEDILGFSRQAMKKEGKLPEDAEEFIVCKNIQTQAIEITNILYTNEESKKIESEDFGIYKLGVFPFEENATSAFWNPFDFIVNESGSKDSRKINKTKVFNFYTSRNYYDSNYYYFNHQVQPDLACSIDVLWRRSDGSLVSPGNLDSISFKKDPDLISEKGYGFINRPLQISSRSCTLRANLNIPNANIKSYSYEIFKGKDKKVIDSVIYPTKKSETVLKEKNNRRQIIFSKIPEKSSGKIFSQDLQIFYDNYFSNDTGIENEGSPLIENCYKIKLTISTRQGAVFYYYFYITSEVVLFKTTLDNLYGSVNYNKEKGAAKLSWVADETFPALRKNIEQKILYTTPLKLSADYRGNQIIGQAILPGGTLAYRRKGSEELCIEGINSNNLLRGQFNNFNFLFRLSNKIESYNFGTNEEPLTLFKIADDRAETLIFFGIKKSKEGNFTFVTGYQANSGIAYGSDIGTIGIRKASLVNQDNEKVVSPLSQINNNDGLIDEISKAFGCYTYILPENMGPTGIKNNLPVQGSASVDFTLPNEGINWEDICFRFSILRDFVSSRAGAGEGDTSGEKIRISLMAFWNGPQYQEGLSAPVKPAFEAFLKSPNPTYFGDLDCKVKRTPSGNIYINPSPYEQEDQNVLLGQITFLAKSLVDQPIASIQFRGPLELFGQFDVNSRDEKNFLINRGSRVDGAQDALIKMLASDSFSVQFSDELTGSNSAIGAVKEYRIYRTSYKNIKKKNVLTDKNSFVEILEGVPYESEMILSVKANDLEHPLPIETVSESASLKDDTLSDRVYHYLYDYSVPNNGYFKYEIVPISSNKVYNSIALTSGNAENQILFTNGERWYVSALEARPDGSYGIGETWNFIVGVESATFNHNINKTFQSGFSAYPKVITGYNNYLTTSLTAYLGKFSFKNDCSYEDDIRLIDRWNDFIFHHNLMLIKDVKGHSFIGTISNSTDISDAFIPEMPTKVSFQITQLGDIRDYNIYDY